MPTVSALLVQPIGDTRRFGYCFKVREGTGLLELDLSKGARSFPSWNGCLRDFLALEDVERHPNRIIRYAAKYGRLGFCQHQSEESRILGQLPFALSRDCSICRQGWREHKTLQYECYCDLCRPPEPIEAWDRCIKQAHAVVDIAKALRRGRAIRESDLGLLYHVEPHDVGIPTRTHSFGLSAKDGQGIAWHYVVGFLDLWRQHGGLEFVVPQRSGKYTPFAVAHRSRTLLGNLALQLAEYITSEDFATDYKETYEYQCAVCKSEGVSTIVTWKRSKHSNETARCPKHKKAHRASGQLVRDRRAANDGAA